MAALEDLLRDLTRALQAKKEDDALAVRRSIAEQYPETPEGAEASYKIGLAALFRSQDLDAAATAFRASAKAKQKTWSLTARTSLGLLLLRQGKHQQAVFELRRAASARPPTLLVAQAAGLLVLALKEGNQQQEADRAHRQHVSLLDELLKSKDPETAAVARFMRAMEHKFDGQPADAREHLKAVLASDALPEAERASAERALVSL